MEDKHRRWLTWLMFAPPALVVYFLSIRVVVWLTYLACFPVWLMRIYISPVVLACYICPQPISRWLEAYLNAGL